MNILIADTDTHKLPIITPVLTLASRTFVDSRLDALQRDLLTVLTNTCAKRGGALYGSLCDVQRACGMAFSVDDLDRLYECHYVNVLRDHDGWMFIQMEGKAK